MERNIELRSTYLYTDSGLGTLQLNTPDTSLQDKLNIPLKKLNSESSNNLHKKNEFAVATHMSKTIREALDSDMRQIIEPHAAKRLTSIIRQNFKSAGVVSVRDCNQQLEDFNFNSRNNFSNGEGTKYFLRKGSHKGQIILHLPAFIPVKALRVPDDATNFKLSAKLIALSDFELTKGGSELIPCALEDHGKTGDYESPMLPLLKIQTQPITAQITTDRSRGLSERTGVVLLLAIKFFNYTSGKFTHLPEEGIIQILKVL